LLIAKVTELFICAILRGPLDRGVVAAFHTANRSSGLVHELHLINGREEGRKEGGKSVDDPFDKWKRGRKEKGVNHECPKIFRLQQVPMGCGSILWGKKTLNNVTLTRGPIQITS